LKKKIISSVGAAIMLGTLAVGCGAVKPNQQGGGTATTAKTAFKVGLVTDTGGLNDHGFNYLADQGVLKAQKDFGITPSVVQSTSESDYIPNLTRFAQQGYNVVIAVGFLMHDAVESVSQKYPNTKFFIIDDSITDRSNVASALFKTEQCGYLAGALAGYMQQTKVKGINSKNTVGVVGGQNIPPVTSYIAGFQQGFKKADPNGTVLVKFANSFTDQTLGSTIAQNMISQGADIVFPVAGGTGVGSIQAAKSAGVFAIGVDADQNYLAPQTVLTSALKGVDTSTYDIIKQAKNNQFKSGDLMFDLSNNGVSIAQPIATVPSDITTKVNDLAKQIKDGTITVSSAMK
jgi:basic membrane protein A and related proteins